MFTKYRNS